MVIDLHDRLVVFRDTETEQRIKIRAEAGNPVSAIDAAMKVLDEGTVGRHVWLVMESCVSLEHGRTHACTAHHARAQ